MNDLVEQVADVVRRGCGPRHEAPSDEIARAAIAAVLDDLMEPSEAMIESAHKVWSDHDQKRVELTGGSGSVAHMHWETRYWQAMLAAKRKELGL